MTVLLLCFFSFLATSNAPGRLPTAFNVLAVEICKNTKYQDILPIHATSRHFSTIRCEKEIIVDGEREYFISATVPTLGKVSLFGGPVSLFQSADDLRSALLVALPLFALSFFFHSTTPRLAGTVVWHCKTARQSHGVRQDLPYDLVCSTLVTTNV